MKKDEIIKFLDDNKITYNVQATYKELLKVYYDNQKPITEEVVEATSSNDDVISNIITEPTVFEEVLVFTSSEENQEVIVNEVVAEVTSSMSIRDKLIVEIVSFMASIKGKTKGSPSEIKKMFELYNNFYKRSETPACSICIGNVHSKMTAIYNKYK